MGSSNSRHASPPQATASEGGGGGGVVVATDGRDPGDYPAATTRRESQTRGSSARERYRRRFCGGRFRSSSRHQQQQSEATTPTLTNSSSTSNGTGNGTGSDPHPVTLGASISGRRHAFAKGNATSSLDNTVLPLEQQRDQSNPFSSATVVATTTAQAGSSSNGSGSSSISAASATEPTSSITAISSGADPQATISTIADMSFARNHNVENSSSRSSSSDNSTSSTRRSSFNSPPRVLPSSRHHHADSSSTGGIGRSSSVGLVMEILPMAMLGAAAAASAGADRDPISLISSADMADSRPIRSLGSAGADARHVWLEGNSPWGGASRLLGSSGAGGEIIDSSTSSAAGGSGSGNGGSSGSSGALAGLSQSTSRQNNPQAVVCDGGGGGSHHHRHEMEERMRRYAGLPPSSSVDLHDLERRGVLTSSTSAAAESSSAQSQRTGNASSSTLGSDHHHYHHYHHHHNNNSSSSGGSSRRGDALRTWEITEEGRLIEYRHSMYSEPWGGERNWSFHRSESRNGSSTTTAGDSSSSNTSNNNTTSSSSSSSAPRQQPPPPGASSSSSSSTTTTATPLGSSASAPAPASAESRESRRHGGRRLWDTLTRHRRASTPLSVPASSESAGTAGAGSGGGGDGGSSGWGLPQSSDDEHVDFRGFHHNRSPDLEERRLRVRSQVWALQLLSNGLDGYSRPCTSGGHHHGHCSCEMHPSAEESSTRASISRIIMLAEALFEVLDEIHRQSIALSRTSAPIASLPAPDDVVEAIPTKNFSKKWWEEATQCNICLVEYEEGDQVRVLPCQHEYHKACVDKWLKEVHRVCPLCRGNVCEITSAAHSPLST